MAVDDTGQVTSDGTSIVGVIGTCEDIVTAKWNSSIGWANEALKAVNDYLTALTTALNQTPWPTTTQLGLTADLWKKIDSGVDYTGFVVPTQIPAIEFNVDKSYPAAFAPNTKITPIAVSDNDFPQFTGREPNISYMPTPSATLPPAPTDKPTIKQIDVANEIPFDIPPVPPIHDFDIPPVPQYIIPPWDVDSPNIELLPPEMNFNYSESPYLSDLKDKTYAKLVNLVVNGGTGLGADIEEALWQRALDRMTVSNEKTYREAEQYFAARGYVLPPGQLAGRLQEAAREITRAEEQLNYEISIEQARLAFDMTKFGLSTSVAYEQTLMDYANKMAQRLYETQKTIVEAGVQVFNAKVSYYNLFLERYKTEASVYKIRVDAVVASLEGYKAQLQGLQLITEIDKNRIEVYKGQLTGCQLLVEVFKSRLEANRIEEEIEKLKVDIFRLEVETYTAQVNAKTAEFNMYQAQIAGEKTKEEVYAEQVKAYSEMIGAKKAYYDVLVAQLDSYVKAFNAEAQSYTAGIEAYRVQVAAETARIDALAKVYELDADEYKESIQLAASKTEAQIKEFLGKIEQMKGQTEVDLKTIQLTIENQKAVTDLILESNKTLANVEMQKAAGAMSALSAQAHIQASASYANNFDAQLSESHSYKDKGGINNPSQT